MSPKLPQTLVALLGIFLLSCLYAPSSPSATLAVSKPLAVSVLVLLACSLASRSYFGSYLHFLAAPVFSMNRAWHLRFSSRLAVPVGGEIGGLANEGNTCFMNSVLQALASSRSLTAFFAEKLGDGDPDMRFTATLKALLDDLNGSYGSRGKEFSTRTLLKRMSDGPKQNFFMGYNQEDAQEFYQQIMRIVEKELKTKKKEKEEKKTFVPMQKSNSTTVYVPAEQIDPNVPALDNLAFPFSLITPVDGISAERIGCMNCGETGGIRYSVNSGLSLNLPHDRTYGSYYKLYNLLDEWKKPEFIDDVNCNRCGLVQTREFLHQQMENNEALVPKFTDRIQEIENELQKLYISDEVFERLTTKQMIRKTRKSKQIFMGTPPPLLCIHINRSVMDPNTFMIMKNSKSLSFPAVLDMGPYIADASDINMDARRPFRKQDEATEDERSQADSVEQNGTEESDTEMEKSETDSLEKSDVLMEEQTTANAANEAKQCSEKDSSDSVKYSLRAVILHMGTHNYGHYICYRHLRGVWWKANDEAIYATTEEEVLLSPGTFMLFYERSDQNDGAEEETLKPESENSDDSSDEDNIFEKDGQEMRSDDSEEAPKHHIGEERAFHV